MPVPETVISEILNSVNIVDFISQYVQLKKAGKNYVGLCPFHSEKTPSFSVSPEKNLFYCFGCGEGGNIFSFLMKYENLTFPEAAKTIARYYGIRFPDNYKNGFHSKSDDEREKILSLNKFAADYFNHMLLKTDKGKNALEYLNSRKLPGNIINDYYIGLAPDGWDGLSSFIKKRGFSEELAEKAGLIAKRKSGNGYYDRFRSRIIFPITNLHGDFVGFGGRILGEGNPKYLNSPETPVYHKSRSLYGLKQAALHCRKENRVYIVEGYVDVLALSKADIKNSVATLGTSLTPGHIKILKGYAEKMVLVYDGDAAGIRAAVRSIDIFANEEIDVSVLVLPKGMDPDDYINKYGSQEFLNSAENAKSAIDFLTETYTTENGETIDGKIKTISSLEPVLKKIKDPVVRSLYVSKVSALLQIPEKAIFERLGSGRSVRFNNNNIKKTDPTKASKIEVSILSAMIDLPEFIDDVNKTGIINMIEDPLLKTSMEKIIQNKNFNNSLANVDAEVQPLIAKFGMEQGMWNIKQARILLKQFRYAKKRKGLTP